MNNFQDKTIHNDKMKMLKELLKKQIVNEEKKKELLHILNYLEHQKVHHQDDIYLKDEISQLYECLL